MITGATLQMPLAADRRGTLATLATPVALVAQSIRSILLTRQGERPMLPDYGIPDFAFAVVADAGFAARVAYFVEQQILRYEPLVGQVKAVGGILADDGFAPSLLAEPHRAAISVTYTLRGDNTPRNLVFPLFQLM